MHLVTGAEVQLKLVSSPKTYKGLSPPCGWTLGPTDIRGKAGTNFTAATYQAQSLGRRKQEAGPSDPEHPTILPRSGL